MNNELPESATSSIADQPHFQRSVGLWSAVAVNMTQMCGIGPFITIPLAVAAMGGPQVIVAWVLGAVLVLADGLVWAELGAAMPGAGGTYLYLREAFQYRTGRLMPFLFIWTAMLAIPLIMSSGVIGLLKYVAYYGSAAAQSNVSDVAAGAPAAVANSSLSTAALIAPDESNIIALTPKGIALSFGVVALVVTALYQKIKFVEKLTVALWIIMFVSVAGVIAASFAHFDARQAFHFSPDAFRFDRAFFLGLGGALVFAVYDYLGYNTTAYMGSEMRDPGRVIPRSITYSILGMMVIYLVMNIGILGALPVDQIKGSDFFASIVVEQNWGPWAAKILTALIVITALASIFTGLLGGSRVPFNAAKDKLFLPIFGKLHPRLNIPHVSILVMGLITALGSLFKLDTVIALLTAVTVLVQAIAQIVALTVLRSRQPNLPRPYKMFCYPLPSLIALVGWIFIYVASGWPMLLDPKSVAGLQGADYWKAILLAPGPLSLAWLALGVIAFLIWARFEKTWPFGPKEIRHEFA